MAVASSMLAPPATGLPFLQRSIQVEAGRRFAVAAAFFFLLGFLPLPFGSLVTLVFGAGAIMAAWEVARGSARLAFPYAVRFAAMAAFAYFAVDALGVLIYPDRSQAWRPIVGSLHFLALPFLIAALSPATGFDPLRMLIRGARLGAIVSAPIAAFQMADGLDRAVGGMINPIPFGTIATLFAFLSLIGFGDEQTRGRVFAILAFAAGLTGSALSASRGGWIPIPVFAAILLVYLWQRHGRRTAAVTALAMAAAAALVTLLARDEIRERLDETVIMFRGFEFGQAEIGEIATLDQRALMTAYGLEAIRDRPILGYGPQNAVAEVRGRAAADGYTIEPYNHLHNEYITETVGNGVFGLATLLLVLAAPIVTALRSRRDGRYADRLAAALLVSSGSAIFGLTGISFGHDLTNSVFVGALLAIGLSAIGSEQSAPATPGP